MSCRCPWSDYKRLFWDEEYLEEIKDMIPDYIAKISGKRFLPEPITEITKEEWEKLFWEEISSALPYCIEHRIIKMKCDEYGKEREWRGIMVIFWFRDYALGVWTLGGEARKYFYIGCRHEYVELTREEKIKEGFPASETFHVYRCSKCGHIIVIDSGD